MAFHGDEKLRDIVDFLSEKSKFYIETGTHKGHTFSYMAKKYSHIECLGCEPARGRFDIVKKRIKDFENSTVFNETSQIFMRRLKSDHKNIFEGPTLFWLDAHSKMFEWPLAEELTFFTKYMKSGSILIDDFHVPGQPQFRYNKYGKQRYTYAYASKFLDKEKKYKVYSPTYKKSKVNQVLTGWILIQFGENNSIVDTKFKDIIKRVHPKKKGRKKA